MAVSLIQRSITIFTLLLWGFFPLYGTDKPLILVFGPKGGAFDDVTQSITDELVDEFTVESIQLNSGNTLEEMGRQFSRGPAAVVLMDNYMISLYRHYQAKFPTDHAFPPAIGVMALFMEDAIRGIRNIEGVAYESPALNSFVNLRDVISHPLHRIGVVHRKQNLNFVKRQALLCDSEKFQLIPYQLENREPDMISAIRAALDELIKKQKVDALWILNDSGLLEKELIEEAWIPKLKSFRKPVIVGVDTLIQLPHMGNFAVLPDHHDMGRQIAQTLLRWSENGWLIQSGLVKEPISSSSILNLGFAKRYLGVRKEKLGQIDTLISR